MDELALELESVPALSCCVSAKLQGRQKRTSPLSRGLTSSSASTNAYAAFDMVDGPEKRGKQRKERIQG